MYATFAWRYFKAKKSANAINIISWVTTGVIAFATCCQVLVLSVFNGFESLVKQMYSSFYPDIKIIPTKGKTFTLSPAQLTAINSQPMVRRWSGVVEETALLQFDEQQTSIRLKGVEEHFPEVSGVAAKTNQGSFRLGDTDSPGLVIGSGVQYASGIIISEAYAPEKTALILPRKTTISSDPMQAISEGVATVNGSFAIQQEFDNGYAITNIGFMRQQMQLAANEYSALEIRLRESEQAEKARETLQQLMGEGFTVQTKYEQNTSLYRTMKMEKWAIYAILTLILVIAAFNMVSALTMLVLEKKQDISILLSMGSTPGQVKRIFLSEGLLLGLVGTATGILLASAICLLQLKLKIIKLAGDSFLIDYFPVKLQLPDFVLVAATAIAITLAAAWYPSVKASRQQLALR